MTGKNGRSRGLSIRAGAGVEVGDALGSSQFSDSTKDVLRFAAGPFRIPFEDFPHARATRPEPW